MDRQPGRQAVLRMRLDRRRLLGLVAGGAVAGILAACGSSSEATSTPKTGGAASVSSTSQGVVTILTPTPAAGAATTPPSGSAPSGTTAPASITTTRPELKGNISMARQPNAPLSNGKPDPDTVIFGELLKRYQQEHPGVTIDLTEIPGTTATELYQWVTTHTAS